MRLDLRRPLQISDGARQLQDAVEGARTHTEFRHGGAQPRRTNGGTQTAGPCPGTKSLRFAAVHSTLLAVASTIHAGQGCLEESLLHVFTKPHIIHV